MSRKSMKIQRELEALGHTNVSVWWEALMPATEMCGCGGGFMFSSDQNPGVNPLAISLQMAIDATKYYKQKEEKRDGNYNQG